ncbi:glycosyl hydrolase [Paenibacillus sp. LHD-117]|uniref:glycosyl hydrolase n=1 Tax=Paenibacillus sp. LHD-117 TaxID=3071412 RepID=UPI0027E0D7B7|nr:glycosyl hydrolase [Paenibacillus sp. LHD-117]MDQ6422881.1 glycosyl hydrolase [Paenibacillus sp. LHD-117]
MRLKLGIAAVAFAAWGLTACSGGNEENVRRFEAEDGTMRGVNVAADSVGYSGEGYVTGFDAEDDQLTLKLEAPEKGLYELRIGYRSVSGDKTARLSLNGEPFGDLKLAASDTFTESDGGKVWLEEGENELSIHSYWGWYDIDYVTIAKAEPRAEHDVRRVLSNPNASAEAMALHDFLVAQYGKVILSGQQTLKDALQLKWDYGKLPAIAGFDLIEYSPTRRQNGSTSKEIEDIQQWHELGGITTLAWHWNAPANLVNSEQQPWWKGFYKEGTTFDLPGALAAPESEGYKLILRDIDAIAEQLKRLEEARIPVLWRPLHEAEGGWFWWGAHGPESAKQLWRLLYDRIVSVHGIDNLIWIWNSESADWYPGDDVVDIVSIDSYPEPGDYGPVSASYEKLVKLVGDKKLVAMTENGAIPDPDRLVQYKANWSWYCTWTGEFIRDGSHNGKEHIRKVLEHEYVMTLDELPDF